MLRKVNMSDLIQVVRDHLDRIAEKSGIKIITKVTPPFDDRYTFIIESEKPYKFARFKQHEINVIEITLRDTAEIPISIDTMSEYDIAVDGIEEKDGKYYIKIKMYMPQFLSNIKRDGNKITLIFYKPEPCEDDLEEDLLDEDVDEYLDFDS